MERGNKQTYEQICTEISHYLNKDMIVLELACGRRPTSCTDQLAKAVGAAYNSL